MDNFENKIIKRISGHETGWAFTPKDFADIGNRSLIDVSLHRLRKKGTIRQLMRGVYDKPGYSELFKSQSSPNPDQIAQAIARNYGWTIIPSGETALNLLGISRQVPSKYIYFSDGPTKKYSLEKRDFVFKRRAIKETGSLSRKTALVVQALKALGEGNINEETKKRFIASLTSDEKARALREAKYATSWVYETIKSFSIGENRRG